MIAIREDAGALVGRMISPVVEAISRARHARMFHPDGRTFAGHAAPLDAHGAVALVGEVLSGPVLCRFSGALWRHGVERLEVLGAALRFRRGDLADTRASPDDQDLLFASILSPFTMPFSPLTTDARDYFGNRYWAVSPFAVKGIGRLKFRLSPARPPGASEGSRDERLLSLVASKRATLDLEARPTFSLGWTTVARITLERVVDVDQAALRFSAFQCGRGVVPRGFVHAMRKPAYAASQRGRGAPG